MTLRYSFERLNRGVEILATHPGPIKARLAEAFHRSLCAVVPGLLPAAAVSIWNAAWRVVTARPADDQSGAFDVSIEALSDQEAVAVVWQVLEVERLVRLAIAMDAGPDLLLM
jgi:hypothetical protein